MLFGDSHFPTMLWWKTVWHSRQTIPKAKLEIMKCIGFQEVLLGDEPNPSHPDEKPALDTRSLPVLASSQSLNEIASREISPHNRRCTCLIRIPYAPIFSRPLSAEQTSENSKPLGQRTDGVPKGLAKPTKEDFERQEWAPRWRRRRRKRGRLANDRHREREWTRGSETRKKHRNEMATGGRWCETAVGHCRLVVGLRRCCLGWFRGQVVC